MTTGVAKFTTTSGAIGRAGDPQARLHLTHIERPRVQSLQPVLNVLARHHIQVSLWPALPVPGDKSNCPLRATLSPAGR